MEVQSPYNRICISHNREGHRAFAVFLLSFFVGKCRRAVSGVRCRSPPLHLDFYISKIQIGGISGEIRTKKSIYQRKRRLCGTVLYGFLPPQASRQGIYGQAVYPRPRLSACLMPVQLFVSVTRFIVQYRITKLLESALFYKLPAIRFHILTPFLVGKLVVLPPFRGAILPFEKNAEDFRIFFKKFFEQQNTPVRKARTDV